MDKNQILKKHIKGVHVNHHYVSIINSYMIALVCSGNVIARILNILGIIESGLYPMIIAFALTTSVFSCLIFTNFESFQMNKLSLVLILSIISLFLISYIRLDSYTYLNEYFIEFMSYGFILFIMFSIPFYYKTIIEGISILTLFILINPVATINGLISERGVGSGDLQIDMGLSYALLPSVIAAIVHFIFYRKNSNTIIKFSYLINIFLFIFLITLSVRGIIISFVVLFYTLIFSLIKSKFKILGNMFLYVSMGVFILALIKLEEIITIIYQYLLDKGIEITALTKSVQKMQGNTGVASGRLDIYENVINLVKENPLLGKGISYYAYYSDGTFPHNIILQSMLETGLILTLPILLVILIATKISFSSMDEYNNKAFKIFILFCFSSAIPRLMFSSYLWKEQLFWALVLVILSRFYKKRDKFSSKDTNRHSCAE